MQIPELGDDAERDSGGARIDRNTLYLSCNCADRRTWSEKDPPRLNGMEITGGERSLEIACCESVCCISLKGISLEPILRSHFAMACEALLSKPVVSDVSKQDVGHGSRYKVKRACPFTVKEALRGLYKDFPGGPVARTPRFHH